MRILLIMPYLSDAPPRFPLGIGYIASVLLEAGHTVEVIDLNAQDESDDQLRARIKDDCFDLIGLTAMITQFQQVKLLSNLIREVCNGIIVLGRGLASAVPEMILKETDVDIAVLGEGEKTIVELAEKIEKEESFEDVKGIAYINEGDIIKTLQQSYVSDLSSLSFPAWELFPIDKYFQGSELGFPIKKMSVLSTRGCPYHCNFCYHGIFGYKYRVRTAVEVMDEIKMLSEKYGISGIIFEDDLFVINRKRVVEFCDLLIESDLNVLWTCNARVNLVDEELLKKMKTAGCVSIAYGIESGSQEMLNKIDKASTVEVAREAIKLTWAAGIRPHGFMMLGTPGESEKTVRESIDFCKDVGLSAEFSITTPIPGTPLFKEVMDERKIDSMESLVRNWGHWLEDVLVNMTELSNEDLIKFKKDAEREVFLSHIRNKAVIYLPILFREYKLKGVSAVVNRIFRGIKLIFKVVFGGGMSGIKIRTNNSK